MSPDSVESPEYQPESGGRILLEGFSPGETCLGSLFSPYRKLCGETGQFLRTSPYSGSSHQRWVVALVGAPRRLGCVDLSSVDVDPPRRDVQRQQRRRPRRDVEVCPAGVVLQPQPRQILRGPLELVEPRAEREPLVPAESLPVPWTLLCFGPSPRIRTGLRGVNRPLESPTEALTRKSAGSWGPKSKVQDRQ